MFEINHANVLKTMRDSGKLSLLWLMFKKWPVIKRPMVAWDYLRTGQSGGYRRHMTTINDTETGDTAPDHH